MSTITPVAQKAQTELSDLQKFLTELFKECTQTEDEISSSISEIQLNALENLKEYEPQEEEEEVVEAISGYTIFNIESSHNNRTYRMEVHLDNDFTDTAETRIRSALDVMLARIVAGQLRNFIQRAQPGANGLRNRRRKSLPFPHPLPYLNSSPTTIPEQVAEEGAVVEAAVFGALNSTSPTTRRKLTLNAYQNSNENVFGKAPVNSYNRQRALYVSLNTNAFQPSRTDDIWAGVIAHEILHNLGWEHPDNQYTLAMPIEIYQACISGGHHLDASFIR
ncbi:MAG TPA: hypothetical protein VMR70_01185 [Flavisolibacter sp.]|nr:hypothetical protein [Flavisolibacter sp.]